MVNNKCVIFPHNLPLYDHIFAPNRTLVYLFTVKRRVLEPITHKILKSSLKRCPPKAIFNVDHSYATNLDYGVDVHGFARTFYRAFDALRFGAECRHAENDGPDGLLSSFAPINSLRLIQESAVVGNINSCLFIKEIQQKNAL